MDDSFIADVNDFAQGVLYATDNGASVVQSALGTLNNSRLAQEAIDYAYRRGVVLIASAADESAGHHNQPSVLEHAVTMNSIGEPEVEQSPASQLPGVQRVHELRRLHHRGGALELLLVRGGRKIGRDGGASLQCRAPSRPSPRASP